MNSYIKNKCKFEKKIKIFIFFRKHAYISEATKDNNSFFHKKQELKIYVLLIYQKI